MNIAMQSKESSERDSGSNDRGVQFNNECGRLRIANR